MISIRQKVNGPEELKEIFELYETQLTDALDSFFTAAPPEIDRDRKKFIGLGYAQGFASSFVRFAPFVVSEDEQSEFTKIGIKTIEDYFGES